MGERKKNRNIWKAERKVHIKKISAQRLKKAQKQAAKSSKYILGNNIARTGKRIFYFHIERILCWVL